MPEMPTPMAVGQQDAPGTPPFGPAPVTMPVPNRGNEAAALSMVQMAIRILEKAVPMLGVETGPGKDVMKALQSLSKHVPPGSTSQGLENTALMNLMQQQRQENPLIAQLRQAQMQGGPQGQPPQPQGQPPMADDAA